MDFKNSTLSFKKRKRCFRFLNFKKALSEKNLRKLSKGINRDDANGYVRLNEVAYVGCTPWRTLKHEV